MLQLILWNMDVYYFIEFWELSGMKMFVEADGCWAVNKFLGAVYVVLCGIIEISGFS